jgi:hypothetical protein
MSEAYFGAVDAFWLWARFLFVMFYRVVMG